MKRWKLSAALLGAAAGICLVSPARAAPSEACDTETVQAMAPPDVTVAFAGREGDACSVRGFVTTRNPGPNKVLFLLVLPNNFNGRYLYLGVGGAAGMMMPPSPALLRKGYAIASGDQGSGAKNGADFSFQKDPAKALDFAWRGVHVAAAGTQQITRTYYKRASIHRYIRGCSGGGHDGVVSAVRFGREDFDGFIMGASSMPDSNYMPHAYRIAQHLQQHPEGWISPELMRKAEAAILARYDETDGARDGIIADDRSIGDFDLDILRQVGFTPAQVATFELIRTAHKYSAPGLPGDGVHPGYTITGVAAWSGFLLGASPPPWPDTRSVSAGEVMGKGVPFLHVMVDSMLRSRHPDIDYWKISNPSELSRLASEGGGDNPDDFSKAVGAKLIFYHGMNDGTASLRETLRSYERLAGRYPDSAQWIRYFTVPGFGHCSGGPGPTDIEDPLLEAMVNWVEQGQTPESVLAPRRAADGVTERTFRLCAEPTRVSLKAPGLDPKQAENWVCRAPERR